MGDKRRNRGEGRDMGGTQVRSRMEKREGRLIGAKLTESVMKAGSDPNFRNRPEIVGMRQKAAAYKAKPQRETLEMAAKRLKKGRG